MFGQDNGRKDKEFLAKEGFVFRSKRACAEFMKFIGTYSQQEVELISKK